MVTPLHRDGVARLAARGAQLLEVLPAAEYDDEHLPGALNIPLEDLGPGTAARLERSRPVIVYCWDGL
jgi:rhodanese-related sulfurtransferase